MTTICVACNVTSTGMINIYSHPNSLDKMFITCSGITEVKQNDYLCIPCYDDLKIAYNFKKKCLQSALLRINRQKAIQQNQIFPITDQSIKAELSPNQLKESTLFSGDIQYSNHNSPDVEAPDLCDNFEPKMSTNTSDELHGTDIAPNCSGEETQTTQSRIPTDIDFKVAMRNDITITNLFNCLPCGKSFTRSGNFRRHQRTIHMIGHKLSSKVGRNKHKRGPSPKLSENDIFALLKDTQCEYCFVNFETEELMKEHEEQHKTEEKPYKCSHDNCSSQFKERFGLRKHLETHSNVKRFKCKFCEQRFHQIGNARSHERYHTGEKPYLCPHCGKSFAESGNLKAHIRFHTGERPYACPQCPKRFTTHYSHKIHIRSHTQERPYLCSDCGKSFKSSGKLLVHKRIHSGHRPYKCDVCPAAFVDNSGLKRHSKIH